MANNLFTSVTCNDFLQFSSAQLSRFFMAQHQLVEELETEVLRLKNFSQELEDKLIMVGNQLIILRHKLYGKRSEKNSSGSEEKPKQGEKPRQGESKKRHTKPQLPSERYPNAPFLEQHLELKDLPTCGCCGSMMKDSGMTEDSEFLTVVPTQYLVMRQKRHKYRCTSCHGQIHTTPAPARMVPGSSYSDEMILDVALSKYCDLIPVERYSSIAGREGLADLPANSLIGITHNLADFVAPAYDQVHKEITTAPVLHADETPHRMLEGDKKSHWYLWGFSTSTSSYFEIHDTRSGDVASQLLSQSCCEFLVTDVFSGYQKAVRESNKVRLEAQQPLIHSVYCNAHSRRKFKEAAEHFVQEADDFLAAYRRIYRLEEEGKLQPELLRDRRQEMRPIFADMKEQAETIKENYSSKSSLVRALNYFLRNFEALTLFLDNLLLPIDNNHQERLLRNPVIGRKTWYGTHSKRGAKTAAILFSLVESCKLNKINPRQYFRCLIESLHQGRGAFTPKSYLSRDTS